MRLVAFDHRAKSIGKWIYSSDGALPELVDPTSNVKNQRSLWLFTTTTELLLCKTMLYRSTQSNNQSVLPQQRQMSKNALKPRVKAWLGLGAEPHARGRAVRAPHSI